MPAQTSTSGKLIFTGSLANQDDTEQIGSGRGHGELRVGCVIALRPRYC